MDAPPSTRSPPSAPPGAPMLARRYAPAPTERALYTRRYGVPLVRRVLSRAALLRAVREERVARVLYFPAADRERLSGPSGECLVEFLDGSLARAFLPPQDTRLLYAMESHGVVGEALAPELAAASARGSEEHQAALAAAQAFVLRNGAYYAGYGLSVVLLAALYLGVRWQLHRRGDAQERADLRAGARAEREEREKRADADAALDVVQALWERGMGAAEIWRAAGERGLGLQRDEVDREVALLELERKDGRETEVGEAEEGSREAAFRGESKLPSNSDRPSKDSSAPDRPSEDPAALLEALSQKRRARAMKEAAAERAAQEAPEGSELLRMPSRALRAARDPLRQRRIRRAQRELQGVRLQYGDAEAVFFDDVAGLAPVLDEVQEVVDFFRKPHRYAHSGARVPRGVLLEGPPGTGKTLLARAVAGEAGVAFLSVNASEFVEMFVGVGAARVRDIFATARELAPAIVFVDELDSVGRVRGGQQGNDERDQTLNQLLTEMDGFATDARVVVLAATNRRDVLDPALVRAGRFDRLVHVGLPDHAGRLELFCCALRAHPHADPESLDLARLARATGGASGAVIAGLVNEAALGAAARGAQRVEKEDLVEALFRLQGGGACASGLGGPVPDAEEDAGVPVADERVVRVEEGGLDAEEGAKPFEDGSGQPSPPSKPPREETAASRPSSFPSTLPSTPQPRAWGERVTRRLALVEAATALAITLLPALEMVESVTVRPRPRWPQGFTAVAPNEQRSALQLFTARYLREQMVGLLAPRAAEQLRLPPDEHSTLVAGRLASARAVARKMVLSDALAAAESPALGPRALTVAAQVGARQTVQFLPRTVPTEVLEEADALMERLLQAAQRQARELLQRNARALDALVQALVEQHTLSGDAVRLIVEEHGHPDDLERRRRDAAEFL